MDSTGEEYKIDNYVENREKIGEKTGGHIERNSCSVSKAIHRYNVSKVKTKSKTAHSGSSVTTAR